MMTQPWNVIIERYDRYGAEPKHRAILALRNLAQRISESPLAQGLFPSPHMFDLDILQREVEYPYDGPLLRLSAISDDQIEFRYVDTYEKQRQWHRTVAADQAWSRLIKFLDQLRWFPADLLESLDKQTR